MQFSNPNREIKRTLDWFAKAVPNPTLDNVSTQTGVMLEEVAEFLQACGLHNEAVELSLVANRFKDKHPMYQSLLSQAMSSDDRKIEVLDALADIYVTALGIAELSGMDMESAIKEVNDSNWSKFDGGNPIFLENGKIGKGPDYRKPVLAPFIKKEVKR